MFWWTIPLNMQFSLVSGPRLLLRSTCWTCVNSGSRFIRVKTPTAGGGYWPDLLAVSHQMFLKHQLTLNYLLTPVRPLSRVALISFLWQAWLHHVISPLLNSFLVPCLPANGLNPIGRGFKKPGSCTLAQHDVGPNDIFIFGLRIWNFKIWMKWFSCA